MTSHSLKYFFEKQQKAAVEQGNQAEHNISSQSCTPPIVDVEAHSSLNDDPESEIIDDDEPVQKKAKRGFQLKWKEQMPWIKWDSKKDLVTCKVCTDAKICTDNVQWTMGLLHCPIKEGWKKYTFMQHEKSEGHKAALKVPAYRNEFRSAHGAAMAKVVTPLPGKLMLMRNVLFAVKNELLISMVEKLHDLLMGHLSQLDDKSNKENNNSNEKSPFKIPGIDFHTSNYSTYEFLDALNKYVEIKYV